ncbi:MAG: ABC transporter substrate-binding protein [Bacteroidales bacterium]|nr:ABC transporter substrate-binding protein [Bacteroidales bacterium]
MIQSKILLQFGLLIAFITGSGFINDSGLNNFTNQENSNSNTSKEDCIRIGLLIPDQQTLSAKHGAELAIRRANDKGGYSGKTFKLITRSVEGPWGAGSKESVNLVFEDEVVAILGSLDGRNAHLAEQVATKAHIVFLSTLATDPSLSQAFVPWYFRCLPSDKQQGEALFHEIYEKKLMKNVATIASSDYDAMLAANTFSKILVAEGKKAPEQIFYTSTFEAIKEFLILLKTAEIESIVFFGKADSSLKIIEQIRKRELQQHIFGNISLLEDESILRSAGSILEGAIIVSPNHYNTLQGRKFKQDFIKVYGYSPDIAAAYAYDGMNLILKAISKDGFDLEKIRDSLSQINYKDGVTGEIHFDDKGNRMGKVGLIKVKNGKAVNIH